MGTSEQRPLRILAADDSAVMRSILWKLFLMHREDRSSELPKMELCGMARDGVECLEQVKQLGPDVLVLYLEMPRLNGLEVLGRLQLEKSTARLRGEAAHQPVIVHPIVLYGRQAA